MGRSLEAKDQQLSEANAKIEALQAVVDAAEMVFTVQDKTLRGHWRLAQLEKALAKLNGGDDDSKTY